MGARRRRVCGGRRPQARGLGAAKPPEAARAGAEAAGIPDGPSEVPRSGGGRIAVPDPRWDGRPGGRAVRGFARGRRQPRKKRGPGAEDPGRRRGCGLWEDGRAPPPPAPVLRRRADRGVAGFARGINGARRGVLRKAADWRAADGRAPPDRGSGKRRPYVWYPPAGRQVGARGSGKRRPGPAECSGPALCCRLAVGPFAYRGVLRAGFMLRRRPKTTLGPMQNGTAIRHPGIRRRNRITGDCSQTRKSRVICRARSGL